MKKMKTKKLIGGVLATVLSVTMVLSSMQNREVQAATKAKNSSVDTISSSKLLKKYKKVIVQRKVDGFKESAEVIQSPSGMILVTEDGTASLGHTTSIYKYVNGKIKKIFSEWQVSLYFYKNNIVTVYKPNSQAFLSNERKETGTLYTFKNNKLKKVKKYSIKLKSYEDLTSSAVEKKCIKGTLKGTNISQNALKDTTQLKHLYCQQYDGIKLTKTFKNGCNGRGGEPVVKSKAVCAKRSAMIAQSGSFVYFVSRTGGGDGIYKYNISTKKGKKISSRILGTDSETKNAIFADSLLVSGKYVYIYAFVYDNEKTCVYRMNLNGSGKKRLYKGISQGSCLLKSGNKIYMQKTGSNSYKCFDINGRNSKNVKMDIKVSTSAPVDYIYAEMKLNGEMNTGKLHYKISKDSKKLICNKRTIYACKGNTKIYDVAVHKKSVVLVVMNGVKVKSIYMNSKGNKRKVLNTGYMAG